MPEEEILGFIQPKEKDIFGFVQPHPDEGCANPDCRCNSGSLSVMTPPWTYGSKYRVPYGGPVMSSNEQDAVRETMEKGRFWDGEKTAEFEKLLCQTTGASDAVFTNSGSSALLLALEAAKDIGGLKRGDRVLTVALTFPTAVNVIVQQGYVPVFMDINPRSLQVSPGTVQEAIKKFKPKAAIITHVIGNSPKMDIIRDTLADKKVIGIEDACDCLGGKYDGQAVGTMLDFGCYSFHPAHPLTAGIGGAVVTKHMDMSQLHDYYSKTVVGLGELISKGEILRRYRDWGRIPQNYFQEGRFFTYKEHRLDKRYTYTHLAYNLMCSELHAAIGVEQLKKLTGFVSRRKYIFERIQTALTETLAENQLFHPEVNEKADPVWFGYPITRFNANYEKEVAMTFLENRLIETRSIYGGPVTIQPAYTTKPKPKYKIYGSFVGFERDNTLDNSLYIHDNSFWVSCWHGLYQDDVEHLVSTLREFFKKVGER